MPQRAPTSSSLMRPFVVLALPGMYLLYKYNQYRQQQMETARRRVTERELMHLNTKITLKETGWYDPKKLLGSLAVPEMRASTLAARALCLEPRYTRVPCVGGTEGESLVPLFSKAVEYFDFAKHNAMMMTDAVRNAPVAVARNDGPCMRAGDLSEAHALAGLVTSVAHALLCKDIPKVTGFVETDCGQVISPARYIANTVEIGGSGIVKNLGLPKMSESETTMVNFALTELGYKQRLVEDWYSKYCSSSNRFDACQYHFFTPKTYERFLAMDVLLNNTGVCKKLGMPGKLNSIELELLDYALGQVESNIKMSMEWYDALIKSQVIQGQMTVKKMFQKPRHYDRLDACAKHLQ